MPIKDIYMYLNIMYIQGDSGVVDGTVDTISQDFVIREFYIGICMRPILNGYEVMAN
jgi:hypothetical protein